MTEPVNEALPPLTWVIMPVLAHPAYTIAAIQDVLAQTVPVSLLIVNQGVDDAFRTELELLAETYAGQIFLWSHQPPLPSLSATWNRALDFVWAVGGDCALVVNNDVRLHRDTIAILLNRQVNTHAYFVSCVGVTEKQFAEFVDCPTPLIDLGTGGPDFSCFLIDRHCHDQYRFDEAFTPAFCEDLDYHRRLLLAGDGHKIFSVNLPYLHYGSATLKAVPDGQRLQINHAISVGSRQHYLRKWGGPVNDERFLRPFEVRSAVKDGTATTPYLQAHPLTFGEEADRG